MPGDNPYLDVAEAADGSQDNPYMKVAVQNDPLVQAERKYGIGSRQAIALRQARTVASAKANQVGAYRPGTSLNPVHVQPGFPTGLDPHELQLELQAGGLSSTDDPVAQALHSHSPIARQHGAAALNRVTGPMTAEETHFAAAAPSQIANDAADKVQLWHDAVPEYIRHPIVGTAASLANPLGLVEMGNSLATDPVGTAKGIGRSFAAVALPDATPEERVQSLINLALLYAPVKHLATQGAGILSDANSIGDTFAQGFNHPNDVVGRLPDTPDAPPSPPIDTTQATAAGPQAKYSFSAKPAQAPTESNAVPRPETMSEDAFVQEHWKRKAAADLADIEAQIAANPEPPLGQRNQIHQLKSVAKIIRTALLNDVVPPNLEDQLRQQYRTINPAPAETLGDPPSAAAPTPDAAAPTFTTEGGTPVQDGATPKYRFSRQPQAPKVETPTAEAPPAEDLGPGRVDVNSGLPLGALADQAFNRTSTGAKIAPTLGERIRNFFVENLSSLGKMAPDAAQAAAKVGSSQAQTGVILRGAGPAIDRIAPGMWDKLRTALVESRLQGAAQRWNDLAGAVRGHANPQDFPNEYERSHQDLAERLGVHHEVSDALANGDVHGGLDTLAKAYEGAAGRVASVMPAAELDALQKDPKFQEALQFYKTHIETPIAKSHASNEGVFSDALGPLDTYFPLSPLDEAGNALKTGGGFKKAVTNFMKPRNTRNTFASGLAPGYDTGVEALRGALSKAIHTNNRAALIQSLNDSGLVKLIDPTTPTTNEITIRGETFPATVVEVKPSRTIVNDGQVVNVPGKRALVPDWLVKELGPALEGDVRAANPVADKLTTFALHSFAEPAMHAKNLVGAMISGTPYVGRDLATKLVSGVPFTKRLAAIMEIARTNTGDASAISDLTEMADAGALPNRYAASTYSAEFAKASGAKLDKFSFGPLLNGPNGLDVRARLVMWRTAKEVLPNATAAERAEFVNQLGNYNPVMHSHLERTLKGAGISPFFTAGKTMYLNGLRSFGIGMHLPEGASAFTKAKYLAAQQISGGAAGYIATWAIAHHALTGKWPWQDPNSKFGKLPVSEKVANSAIGKRLWPGGPGTAYVNLNFTNPIVDRGARAIGIPGYYNTKMLGGTDQQAYDASSVDRLNTITEPVMSGPLPRFLFSAATGDAPHLSSIRDPQGQRRFSFSKQAPDVGGGLKQTATNIGYAAANVNGTLASLSTAMGMTHQPSYMQDEGVDPITQGVVGIAFPGAIAGRYDNEVMAQRIASQGKEIERAQIRQADPNFGSDDYKAVHDIFAQNHLANRPLERLEQWYFKTAHDPAEHAKWRTELQARAKELHADIQEVLKDPGSKRENIKQFLQDAEHEHAYNDYDDPNAKD